MDTIERLKKMNLLVRKTIRAKEGGRVYKFTEVKAAFGKPESLNWLADTLWGLIKERKPTCAAASGYGGLPLASVIASRHNLKLVLVRESLKKHGKGTWIEGYNPKASDKIVLVDDKCITGTSLNLAIKHLKSTKANIIGSYVIIAAETKEMKTPVFCLATEHDLI